VRGCEVLQFLLLRRRAGQGNYGGGAIRSAVTYGEGGGD